MRLRQSYLIWAIPLFCALFAFSTCEHAFAQAIQTIKRASLSPTNNGEGESYSYDAKISGSGNFVIFTSTADNFTAPGAQIGKKHEHIYLRNVVTGQTTQLDLNSAGQTGSPGSAFTETRVFRSSGYPHLSRDGSFAVFLSSERDLSDDPIEKDGGNWAYLKNLSTGQTRRIPYASREDSSKFEYPAQLGMSGDGSIVAIMSIFSDASDSNCNTCRWELTIYNRNSDTTTVIDTGIQGNKFNPSLSDDGRFIVFENQSGGFDSQVNAYLYDLQQSTVLALNNGNASNAPAISGDGAYIAYVDISVVPAWVHIRERESGNESPVSNSVEPNGISSFPSLSQDGRYIAFLSTASNLVKEDSNDTDDIFVFDRISGKTTLVSVQGTCKDVVTTEDFNTGPPSISSDGKTVAFTVLERLIPADQKDAFGNVEKADTNSFDDVYVATLDYEAEPDVFKKGLTPATPFVSVNCTGSEARLQIEDILTKKTNVSSSGQKIRGNGTSVKKVTREIIITKATGRQDMRKKLVAKRNFVSAGRLPPGIYRAQVQATAKLQNGQTITSRLSKPARFVISK